MGDRRSFSRVNARFRAHARRTDDPAAPPLFRWMRGPEETPSEAELAAAQVPQPLTRYLRALDRKLDMLIGMLGGASVREDYPLRLEVLELSGAGLAFRSDETFEEGDILEIVLQLSETPPRLIAATGKVVGSGREERRRFEFTTIREDDLETVVQFVFQEEREQIRRSKWA